MGACCCRPKSPCGSVEERSGLLQDDARAAGPTGHLVVTTTGSACGPQGDIRKMADTVTLKADDADDTQLTLLPQFEPSEPIVALENGALLMEDAHASDKSAAALEESGDSEKILETFPDRKGSPDLPQEVNRQWESGDERPASPAQVEIIQDGGPEEAQMSPSDDVQDVCRDDEGDEAANGCTLLTTICWNDEDATSSGDAREPSTAATCPDKTSEPNCSTNENSEDGKTCSSLTSGQDETSHDASAEAAEAQLGGDERRPARLNHVETLTAAPEVASGLQENTQAGEDEEKMEDAEVEQQMEESEVGPADGSLRSSEDDLYRDEELPPSPNDTRPAPLENDALEVRCSLGPAVDILSYSRREWRGNTAKSALIRKGYKELSQHFAAVRQVRGDNYCALRATLFQVLSQASQVPAWLQDDDQHVAADLSELMGQWTFPGEAETQADVTQRRLQNYLEILRNKWHAAADCPSAAERRRLCDAAFGGGEEEVAMLEALKLLMLRRAARLHADMRGGGGDVPLFCWLLFARDSSDCPRAFLANHLSRVGVSAGLEQVEMCLLGDALRCTLQVYRLYMADSEEFVAYYPDEHKDDWPRVSLVTEDDRHYNVPVARVDHEDAEEMEEEQVVAAS
ncbi:uncharacterized protein LOC144009173 [Festucalex cinctus]